MTTFNRSLLALAADYGGATRQDLIADLDRQVAALDRQISDAEESLDGNDWPETATELSFLEGKRAELESQRADLELGTGYGRRPATLDRRSSRRLSVMRSRPAKSV